MDRARRHQRLFSALAFGLLALVAELVGRSLTHRLDVGRHVAAPAYSSADYYPFLLAAVKGGIALLLARLAWRFARAHAAARAARRLLAAVGTRPARPASPGSALASALARVVRRHRALLSRPDRRRTAFERPLAAACTLAAHLG